MSDWKISLEPVDRDIHLLGVVANAQEAWSRLSKPARAAVEAAYPDGWVFAHPQTLRALDRHGFIVSYALTDYHLTEAATACARWCVTK